METAKMKELEIYTSLVGNSYQSFPPEDNEAVVFCRESANSHDQNAVAVYSPAGAKFGYVWRRDAFYFARLMDNGIINFSEAKVAGKGSWFYSLRVRVSIDAPDDFLDPAGAWAMSDFTRQVMLMMISKAEKISPDHIFAFKQVFRTMLKDRTLSPENFLLYKLIGDTRFRSTSS